MLGWAGTESGGCVWGKESGIGAAHGAAAAAGEGWHIANTNRDAFRLSSWRRSLAARRDAGGRKEQPAGSGTPVLWALQSRGSARAFSAPRRQPQDRHGGLVLECFDPPEGASPKSPIPAARSAYRDCLRGAVGLQSGRCSDEERRPRRRVCRGHRQVRSGGGEMQNGARAAAGFHRAQQTWRANSLSICP